MIIAIGSDHAGFEGKKIVEDWLLKNGHQVIDKGTFSKDSVDYPDYAKKVAQSVASLESEQGVLLCGSAVGVSIVANKTKGIRAALVFNPEIAKLARAHNNANVMCLPARFLSEAEMKECLSSWFSASFEGGRHSARVDKIEP
ncbi:MAG: ribose 5-phosphate isomerase B [Chloroherpetonaceae bacterium]|nr:ribose 5-phosphate isomerase B [Chloroherpetonaceae bacterium]